MHPTRIFENELELSKAWEEYKEDLKLQANEWLKVQYVGKDGDRKADGQKIPLTFEGFKIYCRKHYGNIEQYFVNKDSLYNDFVSICSYIKEEIRNDQIVGGLLGFYNPSITQRLNNLVEKTEVDHKGEIKTNYDLSKLSEQALKELLNAQQHTTATTD